MEINSNTVLIVDDEPDILDILGIVIQDMDLNIIRASDGREAVEVIKSTNPFLVISDINMPGMDGIGLFNEILKLSEPKPLVVLCTGFVGYEKGDLFKKGAFDFVLKPFDFSAIEEMVTSAKLKNAG
jgi:DNA-binding NtrC family response regulator